MKINEICKENRLKLGLTEEELSKSLNINNDLYSKFEKGEYLFDEKIIKRIIKALYVEREDLFEKDKFNSMEEYITNISLKVIEECEKGDLND